MADGGAAATPQKVQLPIARVIEDVDADLAGRPADERIQELNEHYQTYGMVEQQLIQRRARLSGKMPEIQKTLDALLMLQQRHRDEQEVLFKFELGNQVYAKARVKPTTKANLWLGADVMLEYPLDEATQLLETNVRNCATNLETCKKDLELIKDYKTTTEVNIARVYNHDLMTRRKGSGAGS
jgi:prefoldin subunit 5